MRALLSDAAAATTAKAVRHPAGHMPESIKIGISRIGSQVAIVLRFALPDHCDDDPELVRVRERLAGLFGGAASLDCEQIGEITQLTMRVPAAELRTNSSAQISDEMTGPTAIVAEDEATLRHQLIEQLGQLWPELTIVGKGRWRAGARLLDEHHPDVLFLDIQMPGATGLEVARQRAGAVT